MQQNVNRLNKLGTRKYAQRVADNQISWNKSNDKHRAL